MGFTAGLIFFFLLLAMTTVYTRVLLPAAALAVVASYSLPDAFDCIDNSTLAGIAVGVSMLLASLYLLSPCPGQSPDNQAPLLGRPAPHPPALPIYIMASGAALCNCICMNDLARSPALIFNMYVAFMVQGGSTGLLLPFILTAPLPLILCIGGWLTNLQGVVQAILAGTLFACVAKHWPEGFQTVNKTHKLSYHVLDATSTIVLFVALTSITVI